MTISATLTIDMGHGPIRYDIPDILVFHSELTPVGPLIEFKGLAKRIPDELKVAPVPTKNKVRRNDPDTSFSAALEQTTEKSRKQYSLIYRALHQIGPMTDSEIQQTFERLKFAHSPSGLRSRRAELVEAGWVRATDLRRPSDNGHPSTVWAAIWEGPIHG